MCTTQVSFNSRVRLVPLLYYPIDFIQGKKRNPVMTSDGPMIDYSRKSVGLGFRLRQSIVK